MSAQDKTEQVLRDIHILFSKSEVYDKATNRIILDKKEALLLLNRLTVCIYEIMEEYELTKQSRDKAEREARKKGDEIVWDASRKAEDVYAASVMYTDEALRRVQDIMQHATDSVKEVFDKMNVDLKKEKEIVHRDQSELKSHLQDLTDTEKYLKLIEERNKEIRKEKEKGRAELKNEQTAFAAIKPEIKINAEYFDKAGISLETEVNEEEPPEEAPAAEINVNLDAEYFRWKEKDAPQKTDSKKQDKHSLLARIIKGD